MNLYELREIIRQLELEKSNDNIELLKFYKKAESDLLLELSHKAREIVNRCLDRMISQNEKEVI